MSALDDFLELKDVSEIRKTLNVKINGKDFELVVKPISAEEHVEFQRRCQNINKNRVVFDNGKYTLLVVEECIVEPNFADEGFLKKVGCVSASDFIKRKFPAGVLADILSEIQKISGFESFEMEIEEAKN